MSKNSNSKWNFHRLAERPWSAAAPDGTASSAGLFCWTRPIYGMPNVAPLWFSVARRLKRTFLGQEISPGSPYLFFLFFSVRKPFVAPYFHRKKIPIRNWFGCVAVSTASRWSFFATAWLCHSDVETVGFSSTLELSLPWAVYSRFQSQ